MWKILKHDARGIWDEHDGKLNYFIGLQIKQTNKGIFINKSKYFKELMKIFDMDNCKVIATPISSSTYVDQDESGTLIDITKYWGMLHSLVYLTGSIADIMFSVCLYSLYQSFLKKPTCLM